MSIPLIPPHKGNQQVDTTIPEATQWYLGADHRITNHPAVKSPEDSNSESPAVKVMPMKRARMRHTIRALTPDECKMLEHVFHAQGVELPDPATSTIIGAIDENGVVTDNFIVGQLRLHTEPLHLTAGNEHLFRPLARALYDHIAANVGTVDVFLFAPDGKVGAMAESMGMDKEPWNVYSARVYGNAPNRTDVLMDIDAMSRRGAEANKITLEPLDETDAAFDEAMRHSALPTKE